MEIFTQILPLCLELILWNLSAKLLIQTIRFDRAFGRSLKLNVTVWVPRRLLIDTAQDSGLVEGWYQDMVDHPSLLQWEIRPDASVNVYEAEILRSSERPSNSSIKAVMNIAPEDGGVAAFAEELQPGLVLVPEKEVRVAVSLCKIAYVHSGVILQSAHEPHLNEMVLRSVDTLDNSERLEFPPTETVGSPLYSHRTRINSCARFKSEIMSNPVKNISCSWKPRFRPYRGPLTCLSLSEPELSFRPGY